MTIDLRSDTVTRPSRAMRRAMMDAEVADDILDGDPTTSRLERAVAGILGMPAALFFPSGIQANQTAIMIHTESGSELVLEADAHMIHYEMGAVAALSGVQIRPVVTADGILTADQIVGALRPEGSYMPRVTAVAVENTHNYAGGKVMPLGCWDEIVATCREHELPLHLDGARVWNAATSINETPERVVRGATTVAVCLSKGLGCPVGSCLVGDEAIMGRARELRRMLGGSMRQSGILAAAGLYALEHNMVRLAEDHANAKLLAGCLAEHPLLRVVEPDSNIVMMDLTRPDLEAARIVELIGRAGVALTPYGPRRLRAITHLDVTAEDIETAGWVIRDVLDHVARKNFAGSLRDE
ncbi:MAG: threonine aldolase family protein [Gemmatimonadales bacterium]